MDDPEAIGQRELMLGKANAERSTDPSVAGLTFANYSYDVLQDHREVNRGFERAQSEFERETMSVVVFSDMY